jgi:GT2 family glycosyltransferase
VTRAITVAVCTRGRPELLAGCLRALAPALRPDDRALVVHNADADDGSAAVIAAAGVPWVREPVRGLDRARNRALRTATTGVVAFLDDDARPEPGWIDAIDAAFADDDVWCVTGRVLAAATDTAAERLQESCKSYDRGGEPVRFDRRTRRFFYPVRAGVMGTGSNMAVRREAALALRFDDALDVGTPSRGGGDLDFFYRVVRAGRIVAYRPDAVVRHHHRRTLEELRELRFAYGVASGAFAWKCATSARDPRAWLFLPWKVAFHCAEIASNLCGLRRWPAGLAWAELLGTLRGPRAYRQARREAAALTAVAAAAEVAR